MKSILLVKKVVGLVEMTSGLVNPSFSWPKSQAVKMIFFAPWTSTLIRGEMVKEPKFTFTFTVYSLSLTFEDYWLGWSAKQNKTVNK